jgi:hypothetical protein
MKALLMILMLAVVACGSDDDDDGVDREHIIQQEINALLTLKEGMVYADSNEEARAVINGVGKCRLTDHDETLCTIKRPEYRYQLFIDQEGIIIYIIYEDFR